MGHLLCVPQVTVLTVIAVIPLVTQLILAIAQQYYINGNAILAVHLAHVPVFLQLHRQILRPVKETLLND